MVSCVALRLPPATLPCVLQNLDAVDRTRSSDTKDTEPMRTLVYYLAFWLFLILAMPVMGRLVLLDALGRRDKALLYAQRMAAFWARLQLRLAGAEVVVDGLEHLPASGGFVVCGNHQGAFDIPILLAISPRPLAFVAKKELGRVPLLGFWIKAVGCLMLDRDDARQALAITREGVSRLKDGRGFVVFPEGTRSGSPTLGTFRQGSLQMPIAAGAPIVPVAIIDSYKLTEGGRIRPARVRVIFLPPIATTALSRQDKKGLLEQIRALIETQLAESEDRG